MNRLSGGQKSEFQQGFNLPFFHQNVKTLEFQSKNVYGVRILPAFDLDDSKNPKGPLTFVPYRDPNELDAETGKPLFTSWYFPLKGYKFVGNAQRALLSQLTFEVTDCRGRDPLFDCYLTAKAMPDDHPWHQLVEKPEDTSEGFNAVLSRPRVFNAMNVVAETDKNKFDVRLAVCTKASMDHLKDQLNMLTPMGDTPIDPNWPTFVLGDITSPDYGLWGFVRSGSFNKDNKKMTTMLFEFSQQHDRAVNVVPWRIQMDQAWGQDLLARRYNIGDLNTVTKIPTAEEVLEFIVTDGFLPMELVEAACGNTWAIPKGKSTGYKPTLAWDKAVDKTTGGTSAPPAVTAPPGGRLAFSQPAAAPAQNRQFWLLLPGNQVSQQPIAESTLLSMVIADKSDHTVCVVGQTEWKPASFFGIVAPASVPAAAPVQPPGVPLPPSAPLVPTPPVAPTAPMTPPVAMAPTTTSGPPPGGMGGPPMAPRPNVAMPPSSVPLTPGAPPNMATGIRPTPVQPPAGVPLTPGPAPTPPAAPGVAAAPVVTNVALSDAELAELKVLQVEWNEVSVSGKPIAAEKIQRYLHLNDRLSASRTAMKPTETT